MDRNLIYFDGICFELVVSSSLRLWRRIFAPRVVIHLGMIRFSKESRTYGRIRSDLISLSVEAAHKGAPAVEFLSQIDTFVCHCWGAVSPRSRKETFKHSRQNELQESSAELLKFIHWSRWLTLPLQQNGIA